MNHSLQQALGKRTIVSLLPAATEIVCLLGLEKSLLAISDDSDFPDSVRKLSKITTTTLASNLSSKAIDQQVKAAKHQGRSIFHIDKKLLSHLAPDIILTQELCPVCAPALTDVEKTARMIASHAEILSLDPHTIDGIFENILTVAHHTRTTQQANALVTSFITRLSQLTQKVHMTKPPSVLIIEWLDPLMIAGHWVPEMVERAGGKMLFAKKAEASRYITWEEIIQLDPDILILAPCGFTIERTLQEQSLITKRQGVTNLKAYKEKKIFFIDGNTYLTRPGPRIVDGVEIIAEILHPELFSYTYSKNTWRKADIY